MIGLLMALQAAAGSFSGPSVLNYKEIITSNDYPAEASRDNLGAAVRVQVTVDPSGKPVACVPTLVDGSKRLKDVPCRLARGRGKFSPARDKDGSEIAGVWAGTFMFWLPDSGPRPPVLFDEAYAIDHLPATATKPDVVVEQLVSAEGTVEACQVTSGSGSDALDRAACSVLAPPGATLIDGKPVRAVRRISVRFVAGKE